MKKTLFVLCLFFVVCLIAAPAAFAQYGVSTLNGQARTFTLPDHPEHASFASLAVETSVVGGGSFASAQGERPASDFPRADEVALGTTARELKKQHEAVKKSKVVYVN
jgi:hypothetical protein